MPGPGPGRSLGPFLARPPGRSQTRAHRTLPGVGAGPRRGTYETRKEAEILNDEWINPEAGRMPFPDYAAAWIEERPNRRPNAVGKLARAQMRRARKSAVDGISGTKIARPPTRAS